MMKLDELVTQAMAELSKTRGREALQQNKPVLSVQANVNFYDIDLSTVASWNTQGNLIRLSGQKLVILRDGSHPQGRVHLAMGGATIRDAAPGQRIILPFNGIVPTHSRRSALSGVLRVAAFTDLAQDLQESPNTPSMMAPVDLLGSIIDEHGTDYDFINLPTGPVNPFDGNEFAINGYSRLRLLLKVVGPATTFDLVPWFAVNIPDGAVHEYRWDMGRITVPSPDMSEFGEMPPYRIAFFDIPPMLPIHYAEESVSMNFEVIFQPDEVSGSGAAAIIQGVA